MKPIYSEKELRLITELREIVANILEDEFEETNEFVMSWVRYANYDIKKAEQALRLNRKWRKDNNIGNILQEEVNELEERYKFEMGGFDKEGCPIVGIKLDKDLRDLVHAPNGKARYIRYMLRFCEQTVMLIKQQYFKTDGHVYQFVCIVDMHSFIFSQITSTRVISAMTELARIAENNYPGTIKILQVINTPMMFKIVLNIMKPFLSADTISRLKVHDSNKIKWKQILLETISIDQLPKFLNLETS